MARHKQLHQFAEQIWKAKHSGSSYTQLQELWKCSAATIRYHVETTDETIRNLHNVEHVTMEEIAKKYGVETQLVQDIIEAGEQNDR